MAKPDVIERVCDFIEAKELGMPIKKRFDSLAGQEGICVRPLPATSFVTYYDGTQEIKYVYQVIVRKRSEEEAMNLCWDIAEALDDAVLPSKNGSYQMAGNTIYTEPQELALDEANFYAWQARFTAEIVKR